MTDKTANLAASVSARLRNAARAKKTDYQLILRRYSIERLLYRLSISPYRDRFILKGAMLFTAWLEDPFRPTQDLDLLGHGDGPTSAVEATIRAICQTKVEDDGLVYEIEGLTVEPIRKDQQDGGVRVKTTASLGKIRIPVRIDIGFGDIITPSAHELEFPSLLSSKGPRVLAYPKETVVAEKLQAIVALGRANSRMKDFYDLLAISRLFCFDGQILTMSIRATFDQRMTAIPTNMPEGFGNAFIEDLDKQRQWRAFVRREPLLIDAPSLRESIREITSFMLPPLKAAALRINFGSKWINGGPWSTQPPSS